MNGVNREIKFRAYDIKHKLWVEGFEIQPNGQIVLHYFYNNTVKLVHHGKKHKPSYEADLYVFMQYTGLTDKNGAEIYEGDIVQYHWEDGEADKPEIVKWKAPIFTVDSDIAYDASRLKLNNNYEIIGNIYENPELLTK